MLGEEGTAQGSGEEDHYRRIQDALRTFMVNNNLGPNQKDGDSLQAVIISGEAQRHRSIVSAHSL